MPWVVGTRVEVRAALRAVSVSLGLPLGGLRATGRYTELFKLVTGEVVFHVKAQHVIPAVAALVVASLPVVRRADAGFRATLPARYQSVPAADLPDRMELLALTADRWYPELWRARFQHDALPATYGGGTELWSSTAPFEDTGTLYTRLSDGLQIVLQPVYALPSGARYAVIAWTRVMATFADARVTAATIGDGLITDDTIVRRESCNRVDDCWRIGALTGAGLLATSWPSDWRITNDDDSLGNAVITDPIVSID
jgi:hypothetical protein